MHRQSEHAPERFIPIEVDTRPPRGLREVQQPSDHGEMVLNGRLPPHPVFQHPDLHKTVKPHRPIDRERRQARISQEQPRNTHTRIDGGLEVGTDRPVHHERPLPHPDQLSRIPEVAVLDAISFIRREKPARGHQIVSRRERDEQPDLVQRLDPQPRQIQRGQRRIERRVIYEDPRRLPRRSHVARNRIDQRQVPRRIGDFVMRQSAPPAVIRLSAVHFSTLGAPVRAGFLPVVHQVIPVIRTAERS